MSWLSIPKDSDFSLSNIPFGVVIIKGTPRSATIVGDTVVDLSVLEEAGLFYDIENLRANVFCQSTLNAFLQHPKSVWTATRLRLQSLFADGGDARLRDNATMQSAALYNANDVESCMPVTVGDYTDFYSSREHATNVGIMFRGKDNALQPNWLHLPVGYHGRCSSLYLSGKPIRRPSGQLQKDKDDPKQGSVHGACKLLDFELEVAAVVGGPPNQEQKPLTLEQAKDRIFGYVIMNDWSARDIQKWEYVPLGPFTAKNFATTVSPWIVTLDALEDFRATTSAGPQQVNPTPLSYLQDPNYGSYHVNLSVGLKTASQNEYTTITRSNLKNMYWNAAQQLAHHSVTGCPMVAGDMLGSGTISGSEPGSYGSMLELSWKGSKEIPVGDEVRKFLKDGDSVVMKGYCKKQDGTRVGFGECEGTILPVWTDNESSKDTEEATQEVDRYVDFKLYGYWRSSCTWRVRVALAAKSIPYKTIPINILKGEHKSEEYLAKYPMGQVPVLECTDRVTGKVISLGQSIAILEFLDEVFPERKSLLPTSPEDRAVAREMVEVINAGTQPLQNIILLKQLEEQSKGKIKANDQAKAVNEKGLAALELLVSRRRSEKSSGGPYCLGNFAPTIVDATMVPQMFNARRYGANVESICPTLVQIDQLCANHGWFQASNPKVQSDAPEE